MRQAHRFFLLVALTPLLAWTVEAQGQQPAPSTTPSATPTPSPTPVPLAEVVTQAEAAAASLRDTEAGLSSDQTAATIEEELPLLTGDIDARLEETSNVLAANPSLETLRSLEANWQRIGGNLTSRASGLRANATQLDGRIAELVRREDTWRQTLALAQASAGTPPEVIERIEAVVAAIGRTRGAAETRRAQVLTLQGRVAAQDARVREALASVRRAREEAVNRLFVKDSPPVWGAEVRARAGRNLVEESRSSLSTQLAALGAYAGRQRERFFLHVVVIVLLVGALYWVRRRVRPWVEAEPSLKRAALVFDVPVAAAFVLSVVAGGWIYPQAPRLWQAALGAAALVPTVVILRRLAERHLYPVLNALVVFYFFDLLRTLLTSPQLVSRLLLLAEMLGGILFLAWLIKSARLSGVPEEERNLLWKTLRAAARVALASFAAAFVAGALGYVSLANLVANAVLGSAYVAVILYAATRVADGLVMFALRVRPLNLLGMVREHRPLFRRRVRRVLQALAFLLWLYYTLELFSLRAPAAEKIRDVLTAKLVVGSLDVSPGNVLAFGVTVWAAFLLARFARFLLEEDVYPRLALARGVPYAVSTVLNYAILLVGFFVAVAALGIDMTKFTILAGAFGVGLGFGLQNIFNNFVSGLIVLFERPVKVGDVVQMSDAAGVVKRIGIRASVIGTPDGSDIIVPNGKLISDSVTNWTFTSNRRSFVIKVGTAYGTDPRRVIELLKGVAAAHPLAVADPPPQAVFVGFGPDSLDFELRVWTDNFDEWVQIRSDLAVTISTTFLEENIPMPCPQRDLHLRSIDPEALAAIVSRGSGQTDGAAPSATAMAAPESEKV